ncbi:MAG: hypothetical protein MI799_19215, partial [Desulfobacterales bacterium]|nr:hypothetical protein [Desulfobacterales bacterium]
MAINLTLGKKIGGGYTLISVILVFAVLTTIYQVEKTTQVTDRLMTLRVPTSQSSLTMLNGINHSLAALRGWIILGMNKFKAERAKAWSDQIESSLKNMKKFSHNWTNRENIMRLRTLETKLADFKKYQQEIEDIAQTKDNQPALKILFDQAAPRAKVMTSN